MIFFCTLFFLSFVYSCEYEYALKKSKKKVFPHAFFPKVLAKKWPHFFFWKKKSKATLKLSIKSPMNTFLFVLFFFSKMKKKQTNIVKNVFKRKDLKKKGACEGQTNLRTKKESFCSKNVRALIFFLCQSFFFSSWKKNTALEKEKETITFFDSVTWGGEFFRTFSHPLVLLFAFVEVKNTKFRRKRQTCTIFFFSKLRRLCFFLLLAVPQSHEEREKIQNGKERFRLSGHPKFFRYSRSAISFFFL